MADSSLELLLKITADSAQARREIDQLRSSIASGTSNMKGSFSGLESTFNKLGSSLEGAGRRLSILITAPLAALAGLALKSAFNIDTMRNRLIALEGSVEAAEKRLVRLRQVAQESVGVTTQAASETFALFKSIGGITDKTIEQTIKSLGKLNAAFVIDDPDRFARNLTQIFTVGFNRRDIREALRQVPIFNQLLESAFGTSDPAKLRQLAAAGKLTLDSFIAGLSQAVESDTRLSKIGQSASVRFTKAFERLEIALAPLGDALIPILEGIIKQAEPIILALSTAFSQLSEPVKYLIIGFGALAAALGPALLVIGAILTSIGGAISTVTILAGLVGGFAPLIAIVVTAFTTFIVQLAAFGAAVAAVVTAARSIWDNNIGGIQETTRAGFEAVRDFAISSLSEIKAFFERNWPLIQQTVQNVLQAIEDFWKEHGETITAVVKNAWEIIKTVISTALRIALNVIQLTLQVMNSDWEGAFQTTQVITARAVEGLLKIFYNLHVAIARVVLEIIRTIQAKIYEAGISAARFFVDGFTFWMNGEGRAQVASSVVQTAIALSNPAILAYYAASGALAAKARNDAFLTNVSTGAELGKEWDSGLGWQADTPGLPSGLTGAGGGGKGGGGEKSKALEEFLQAAQAAREEQSKIYDDDFQKLQRDYNRRIISLEDYTAKAKQIKKDAFNEDIDRINDETQAIEQSALSRKEKDKKLAELDRDAAQKVREYNRDLQSLEDEKNEKIEQAGVAHKRRVADLNDRAREREIEEIRKGIEINVIEVEDGAARIEKILQDGLEERRAILRAELELAGADTLRRREIYDDWKDLDADYTEKFLENAKRRSDALIEEHRQAVATTLPTDPQGKKENPWEGLGGAAIGGLEMASVGAPPPPDFSAWHQAFELLKGVGTGAFGALAQGMGQMAQAFLGGGKAGENSIKSLVKTIAASLAAQAGVEAIMSLAKGFVQLAEAAANPFDAARHLAAAHLYFTSAAIFGGVAVGGALAAVALGGGGASASRDSAAASAFQPQKSNAGNSKPESIDVGRRKDEAPTVNINITSKPQPGTIIETVVENISQKGRIRDVMLNDGVVTA